MRLFRVALLTVALLFALAARPALAIDYIIELVFFAHTTPSDGAPWENGALLADDGTGLAVFGAGVGGAYQALQDGPALRPIVDKLAGSSRHRLLGYRAWQQTGLPRGEAQPVRIQVGQPFDCWDDGTLPVRASAGFGLGDRYQRYIACGFEPGLSVRRRSFQLNGLATVSLGRYLHLDTELVYTDLRGRRSALEIQHRRMRSRRTHYIDNPAFGIIAHITPVEEPAETDETATTQSE